MKLLADENFPGPVVRALRASGHDVLWAREEQPGAEDEAVLRRAMKDQRILLTFDKDFGELAFRWGLPAPCGVLLFRFMIQDWPTVTRRVVGALASQPSWTGLFAVVESERLRVVRLYSSRHLGGPNAP
jgi:hypothetical protein